MRFSIFLILISGLQSPMSWASEELPPNQACLLTLEQLRREFRGESIRSHEESRSHLVELKNGSVVKARYETSEPFYDGVLHSVFVELPGLARALNIKVRENGWIEIPSYAALRKSLSRPPLKEFASGFQILEFEGEEFERDFFARKLVERVFLIATDIDLKTHDLSAHLPGYLFFPKEISEKLLRRLQLIHRILDDPILGTLPYLEERMRLLEGSVVAAIDQLTFTFGLYLENSFTLVNRERASTGLRAALPSDPVTLLTTGGISGSILFSTEWQWAWLSPEQQKRRDEILKEFPAASVTLTPEFIFDALERKAVSMRKAFGKKNSSKSLAP